MSNLNAASIIAAIQMGELDDHLREINSFAIARQRVIRNQENASALAELKVGDEVKVGDIRPKYMVGMVGIVTDLRRSKAVIRLTATRRRFHEGQEVVIPAASLNRI